jgi:hypothetical protein
MSLASADSRALEQAKKQLEKYGGVATWTDVNTPAIKDDFGNITTPATTKDFTISILPTIIEEGWINSGIAKAQNKVFLVSKKQMDELGASYDDEPEETITYNNVTYAIERDMPYSGGQTVILHRFICSITN